ncbi:MFS transporter [Desulfopila sp. IMCC35008]|uniref:MFS transporter n=1 Tax=Desulfopila sp. IMCC35008 TaxID=2653858 RepID=UPI0013D17CD6|nr:MFS transporter [Desulfopila sp. IMCC35008]
MSDSSPGGEDGLPFATVLRALLFLALIFFLNFTSRVVFSPLLPVVSGELGLDYLDSGSFFFFISAGYFVSILLSGHVSSRLGHTPTVALSSCLSGVMLLVLASCTSFTTLRLGLVGIGMTAGLYFPSGLATIGRMVPSGYLARGMAIHELAPSLSFVLTPLLCGAALPFISWRQGLVVLGCILMVVGALYYLRAQKDCGFGTIPGFSLIMRMVRLPGFWLLTLMFSMAICSTLGIYALLPLYLVTEKGMGEEAANLLVSLSRISSVFMPIAGGWLGDRFGNRKIMGGVLFLAGVLTVPLGVSSGLPLVVLIVAQAMVAVCFFPVGFAEISSLGHGKDKGAAISFLLPLAFLAGGGILPTLIGGVGDMSRLGYGFVVAGSMMILASLAVFGMKGR